MKISAVEALSASVKINTDAPSDKVIISGVLRLPCATDRPMTTGKIGRTHGASTVSAPARKDMSRRVMGRENYLIFAAISATVALPLHELIILPCASTCTNVC